MVLYLHLYLRTIWVADVNYTLCYYKKHLFSRVICEEAMNGIQISSNNRVAIRFCKIAVENIEYIDKEESYKFQDLNDNVSTCRSTKKLYSLFSVTYHFDYTTEWIT